MITPPLKQLRGSQACFERAATGEEVRVTTFRHLTLLFKLEKSGP